MPQQNWLPKLIGKWSGNCQTWFKPDELADESPVIGEFAPVFGGKIVKHTYKGGMQGKPRIGEELIAYNAIKDQYESSWVDDFHMNYAILFSTGPTTENGFHVLGSYDVGQDHPAWGWRTEFSFPNENELTITAFNIQPDGPEAMAVKTEYRRVI